MIDLLKQHQKPLLIGLCLVTLGTGYYYYHQRQQPIPTHKVEKVPQLTYHQIYQQIVDEVQHHLNQGENKLNKDAVFTLYKGQYSLANQQLRAQFHKSRKQRRKLINQPIHYANAILTLKKQLQLILQIHLNTLLKALLIDRQELVEQIDKFSQLTNELKEEWETLKKHQNQKLILSMRDKYRKPKSFPQVKKILQFQIKKLQVLEKDEIDLHTEREDEEKETILATYLKDITFDQFGVEEETLRYSLSLLRQEQHQEVEEIHQKIMKLSYQHVVEDIDLQHERLDSQYF